MTMQRNTNTLPGVTLPLRPSYTFWRSCVSFARHEPGRRRMRASPHTKVFTQEVDMTVKDCFTPKAGNPMPYFYCLNERLLVSLLSINNYMRYLIFFLFWIHYSSLRVICGFIFIHYSLDFLLLRVKEQQAGRMQVCVTGGKKHIL